MSQARRSGKGARGPQRWSRVSQVFGSLANRNYRKYFVGQAVSLSGTWMQSVAQSWIAFLGSTPVGGPIDGYVAQHAGAPWALALGGAAALLAAALGAVAMVRARGERAA